MEQVKKSVALESQEPGHGSGIHYPEERAQACAAPRRF